MHASARATPCTVAVGTHIATQPNVMLSAGCNYLSPALQAHTPLAMLLPVLNTIDAFIAAVNCPGAANYVRQSLHLPVSRPPQPSHCVSVGVLVCC